ncbi:nucleoside recognition domain-containing protein [Schnuerera ultunensis]|uniref:Ferrous iron transport protein B homolog n=1 Tax=[Clostridium] ultunense Esp TaxID=1288971 RepID=A0A1M4PK77_9FIRM
MKSKSILKRINYDGVLEKAIKEIQPLIDNLVGKKMNSRWVSLRIMDGDSKLLESMKDYISFDLSKNELLRKKLETLFTNLKKENIELEKLRDCIVASIVKTAENISEEVVIFENKNHNLLDHKIDRILTSRIFGIPIMIGLLGLVFWITIEGANLPSDILANGLFWIEGKLSNLFKLMKAPNWFHDILVLGIYRTLAWVVSVMLPPMAIFFPLFTLLEDLGYLPRVAFNLDYYFKKAGAHGKQALTMCMGFGCNAAGVISCRIIDSSRERLIAIITNNFVPCNGRFPILIALATIFIGSSTGALSSLTATLSVLIAILLGVIITLFVSKLLSKTILKGLPSSFTLELPPYRKPQVGKIIVRSIFDRTLFVLSRAVIVAAPAGLIIWVMANIIIGNASLLTHCAQFLNPFAQLLGMDGYILMAFILGLPANEIVIPILIMSYMSKGSMLDLDSLTEMKQLLVSNGWNWLTAICTMLFALNHWPCGTTLLTIRKETQSWKWAWVSFLVPTITGIVICFLVAQGARLFGLI